MVNKKIGAIIQARTSSSRLPGKIKLAIGDKQLIERCVAAASKCKKIDLVVIATTREKADDWLVRKYQKNKFVKVFRGDTNDVLSRFSNAAKEFRLDTIIRLTSDDPFKPTWLIEKFIDMSIKEELDYISNTINPTFPEGLDIELISRKALDLASKESKLLSEKEHVTPYIWNNLNLFKYHSEELKKDYSWARLTVDYDKDLLRMNRLWEIFGDKLNSEEIFNCLNCKIEFKKYFLSNTVRNEGYLKSLREDF